MFKRFDASKDCSTSTQVKTSVMRSLKSQLLDKHRNITEEMLEELFPKKHPLIQYKVGPHLMLYCRRHEYAEVVKNKIGDNKDNAFDSGDDNDDDDDDDKSPTDEPVMFQHRDGPILPTLKLVHQYPTLNFTSVTVDKGAIPFILGGANIMCPGLTNPGSSMPIDVQQETDDDNNGNDKQTNTTIKPGLQKGDGVVIFAEGKQYALAVGVMTMSSLEMCVFLEKKMIFKGKIYSGFFLF